MVGPGGRVIHSEGLTDPSVAGQTSRGIPSDDHPLILVLILVLLVLLMLLMHPLHAHLVTGHLLLQSQTASQMTGPQTLRQGPHVLHHFHFGIPHFLVHFHEFRGSEGLVFRGLVPIGGGVVFRVGVVVDGVVVVVVVGGGGVVVVVVVWMVGVSIGRVM